MSRDASVTLTWADSDHVFRLRKGELMQLQEACRAGPMWILNRMMAPTAENLGWRVEDIVEVIRLGLIGGGMEPVKALRMVRDYVEARPLVENLLFAQAILAASLMGAMDGDDLKKSPEASGSTISPADNGDGPPSSGSALQ